MVARAPAEADALLFFVECQAESNSPLDLLEKGISNLTELMAELQQSHAAWSPLYQ